MDFQITIYGNINTTDLHQAELELCRLSGEVRQAALNHHVTLQIPIGGHGSLFGNRDLDGFNCLIRGSKVGPLDLLMRQAEARMRRAECAGDMGAWVEDYLYWLELYGQKNGPFWRSGE